MYNNLNTTECWCIHTIYDLTHVADSREPWVQFKFFKILSDYTFFANIILAQHCKITFMLWEN